MNTNMGVGMWEHTKWCLRNIRTKGNNPLPRLATTELLGQEIGQ